MQILNFLKKSKIFKKISFLLFGEICFFLNLNLLKKF